MWIEGLGVPNSPADVDDWVPRWASVPEVERLLPPSVWHGEGLGDWLRGHEWLRE